MVRGVPATKWTLAVSSSAGTIYERFRSDRFRSLNVLVELVSHLDPRHHQDCEIAYVILKRLERARQ
jgi:hypothetical protein